ncbi:MAG: RNA polymerase-binding protein DksA [Sulfuritalea sp.]|jgi:DnaK suppressor protein|nr:RNA polymerase-binding protein DksA [Sulfuritalea sp.]
MPNTPTISKTLSEKALLAMPAKSYMNAAQLDFFRELLRKQRQDLINNASMTIDHLRDGEAEADPNDRATIEEENSIELRIRDRERKMLPRVEAALKRIENGTFGFCEETGDPIGLPRLLARPTTVFSIEAQERHESRQRIQGK